MEVENTKAQLNLEHDVTEEGGCWVRLELDQQLGAGIE